MKRDIPLADDISSRPEQDTAERLRFWRRSVAKHKWSALGLAFVIALATTLVVFSMTPIYSSTATLLIEAGKSKVVSIEEVYSGMPANREYYQTQVEIIKSRELIEKLVQKLNLVEHPALDPRQRQPGFKFSLSPLAWLPSGWLPEKPAAAIEPPIQSVVGAVMGNLQVQPIRNSQLVRISFDSSDKELAAKIPNVLAELYIENDLDARLQMTQKASSWLTERLGGLRDKLAASERALQQYREREKIIDVKGIALSGAGRQLDEAATSLVSVRQRRADAENAYNQVQAALKTKTELESIPAVLKNPLVQKLKEVEGEAERKWSEASKRYGVEHPRMVAAETELKAARENTRKQIDSVITGVTKEYEVARANEQSLERALAQSKGEIQNINRKEFQLGVLEREVAANRQLYDMFLNRFRETNVAGNLQSTVGRVVDRAVVRNTPVSPQKTRAIGIALVVGVILGLMLALLLEYLDNTVKNSDDVENKLRIPLLGVLQKLKAKKRQELQRAVLKDNQTVFAEAVRTVRASVMMSAFDNPHKVLLITSSVPEEGKTTIATNVAFAFGQIKKVCLVDADMRRPTIAKTLGLDTKAPGLSHLVAGTEQPAKCMYLDEESGIHVIPAGVIPPNPQELLSSARFSEVMKKLNEMFDVVIIDSPPVQLMSDALILSKHANAVVYVVKADSTPYQIARSGIERLQKVGAPLLGVVLNQLDLEKADKYYGYGKYSAYGKGYAYYGYTQKT